MTIAAQKRSGGGFFCFCHAYVSVLVGSDSYELGFWKCEALSLYVTVNVLHPVLRHLHDVQPGLVLMQRLQDNHLHEHIKTMMVIAESMS